MLHKIAYEKESGPKVQNILHKYIVSSDRESDVVVITTAGVTLGVVVV